MISEFAFLGHVPTYPCKISQLVVPIADNVMGLIPSKNNKEMLNFSLKDSQESR